MLEGKLKASFAHPNIQVELGVEYFPYRALYIQCIKCTSLKTSPGCGSPRAVDFVCVTTSSLVDEVRFRSLGLSASCVSQLDVFIPSRGNPLRRQKCVPLTNQCDLRQQAFCRR